MLRGPHLRNLITVPYAIFEKNLENYGRKLLLANSNFTAKAIKDSLGADSAVLYPPVPKAQLGGESEILEKPREDLVVTIARFGRGKNVELVPEIANITSNSIRFVLIGLAHDTSVVRAVESRVRRLGLENRLLIITDASRKEIKSYLSKAKVYLHTTRMEHFGISIVEAMAMGCLPVVHNSGGAPEFVPDRYRYNSVQAAAQTIEYAIGGWSKKEARKMMKISEQFSEANYSKRFIKLFSAYCSSWQEEK